VRRIEAVTGMGAYELVQQGSERLRRLSELLHAQEPELPTAVERALEQLKQAQKENQRLRMKSAQSQAGGSQEVREVAGIKVQATRVDGLDRSQMRALADEFRQKLGSGVVALGGETEGKVTLILSVSADLAKRLPAGGILRGLEGVKGGGRPELAEAGGIPPERLDTVLAQVPAAVEKIVAVKP
jgi:alanyl-tRNA synthetase